MDPDQNSLSNEPDHLWHEANHHPDPRLRERQQYDSLMQEWKSQIEEKKLRKPAHITIKPSQTKVLNFLPRLTPPIGIPFGSQNRRSYHNLNLNQSQRKIKGSPDQKIHSQEFTSNTEPTKSHDHPKSPNPNPTPISPQNQDSPNIPSDSKDYFHTNPQSPYIKDSACLKPTKTYRIGSSNVRNGSKYGDEIPVSEQIKINKSMVDGIGSGSGSGYNVEKAMNRGELREVVDWSRESGFHVTAKKVLLNNIVAGQVHNDFLKGQM
jgi:hypothetical protein